MRRVFFSVAAALLLVVAASGIVSASSPVTITVTGASLVARGAAVEVRVEVVCQPYLDSTTFDVEYATMRVDQAVSRKLMAHGEAEQYLPDMTCDGTTVNTVVARISPDQVPYSKGQALVAVHIALSEQVYWTSQYGDASAVVRLR